MININKALEQICNDKRVNNDNFDLIENNLLDSYTIIALFAFFEDNDIELYPTRVKREDLRTPGSIKRLVKKYMETKE